MMLIVSEKSWLVVVVIEIEEAVVLEGRVDDRDVAHVGGKDAFERRVLDTKRIEGEPLLGGLVHILEDCRPRLLPR